MGNRGGDAAPRPRRVVLDTDYGSYLDDTFALQLLLSLDVEVLAVVTACGDTAARAKIVQEHLKFMGRADVPVGAGVSKESCEPFTPALAGWEAAGSGGDGGGAGPIHTDGVALLADVLTASPEPVVVVSVGPFTNLEALAAQHPGITARHELIVMGGSIAPGIRLPWGPVTPLADYNARSDPGAFAAALRRSEWRRSPRLAAVGSTHDLRIGGKEWARLVQARTEHRGAALMLEMYSYWMAQCKADAKFRCQAEANTLDEVKESPTLFALLPVGLLGGDTEPQGLAGDLYRVVEFAGDGQLFVKGSWNGSAGGAEGEGELLIYTGWESGAHRDAFLADAVTGIIGAPVDAGDPVSTFGLESLVVLACVAASVIGGFVVAGCQRARVRRHEQALRSDTYDQIDELNV